MARGRQHLLSVRTAGRRDRAVDCALAPLLVAAVAAGSLLRTVHRLWRRSHLHPAVVAVLLLQRPLWTSTPAGNRCFHCRHAVLFLGGNPLSPLASGRACAAFGNDSDLLCASLDGVANLFARSARELLCESHSRAGPGAPVAAPSAIRDLSHVYRRTWRSAATGRNSPPAYHQRRQLSGMASRLGRAGHDSRLCRKRRG